MAANRTSHISTGFVTQKLILHRGCVNSIFSKIPSKSIDLLSCPLGIKNSLFVSQNKQKRQEIKNGERLAEPTCIRFECLF